MDSRQYIKRREIKKYINFLSAQWNQVEIKRQQTISIKSRMRLRQTKVENLGWAFLHFIKFCCWFFFLVLVLIFDLEYNLLTTWRFIFAAGFISVVRLMSCEFVFVVFNKPISSNESNLSRVILGAGGLGGVAVSVGGKRGGVLLRILPSYLIWALPSTYVFISCPAEGYKNSSGMGSSRLGGSEDVSIFMCLYLYL